MIPFPSERESPVLTRRKACHEEDISCLQILQMLLQLLGWVCKREGVVLNIDFWFIQVFPFVVQSLEVRCLSPNAYYARTPMPPL